MGWFRYRRRCLADEFWNYDYIGPLAARAGRVSRWQRRLFVALKKLLDALRDDAITLGDDNEDEAICIRHREPLEDKIQHRVRRRARGRPLCI